MSLLIPWAVCALFVIVALIIFIDSRFTERQVDKEWVAIKELRAGLLKREAAAQFMVDQAREEVEAYRVKLAERDVQIDDLKIRDHDLSERIIAYQRRIQLGR